MTNEEMSSQSEPALAYRQKLDHSMTPAERMEIAERLTHQAFERLRSNPEALLEFHRRNHHRRRASQAKRIIAEMKQPIDE